MKYLLIAIILFLFQNCSNNDNLRDIMINHNDYWAYYDENQPGFNGVYLKFDSTGISNQYCKNSDSLEICKGGDLEVTNIPWEITSDSILIRGRSKYNIVSYSKDAVVLYASGQLKRHIFLIKEYPGKLRKGKVYYEDKDNSIHQ